MLLKKFLLILALINTNINFAMEREPEIFAAILDNVDFAALRAEKQELYAQQVNMRSRYGTMPPLFEAISSFKPVSMLTWFITQGADINAKWAGHTPLQFAKRKLEEYKRWTENVARLQSIVNMLETAERQQRAWEAKKFWIAGVGSHC